MNLVSSLAEPLTDFTALSFIMYDLNRKVTSNDSSHPRYKLDQTRRDSSEAWFPVATGSKEKTNPVNAR